MQKNYDEAKNVISAHESPETRRKGIERNLAAEELEYEENLRKALGNIKLLYFKRLAIWGIIILVYEVILSFVIVLDREFGCSIISVFSCWLAGRYVVPALGGLAIGVVGVLMISLAYLLQQASTNEELESLERRKRIEVTLSLPYATAYNSNDKDLDTKAETFSYFDRLVKINITNLAEYYSMVKSHTNNSFRTSLGAGMVGFVLIVFGLLISFFSGRNVEGLAFISTASGIVTEFIAAIFFYLYNRTVRQLKDYHDSLIAVQNILLSFKMLDSLESEELRAKMIQQMLVSLVSKQGVSSLSENGELSLTTTNKVG